MIYEQILDVNCIQKGTKAKDKEGILQEIAELAKKSPLLKKHSKEFIYQALKSREAIGSTGLEEGIAIPHCALEYIEDFVVGLIVVPEGIDFNSFDGKPSELIFFIIGPQSRSNQHIQILSALSKIAKIPRNIKAILTAETPEDIKFTILTAIPHKETIHREKDKEECLMHIFIQREDIFNDVLALLSAQASGAISIVETHSAGFYLKESPVYAAYRNEEKKDFNRLIIARIEKISCNNLIRRINVIAETLKVESGVMITVQNLTYSSGFISF
jgi:mannitol/fructose-specific phosphotransferase system IIA component (Ntr-type)